jgi:hypothetical protein
MQIIMLIKEVDDLREDFDALREDNREARKGIYTRLSELEKMTAHIPSLEQQELINQAAGYYKARRDFWEGLTKELITKGMIGAGLFTATALLYYLKHLLEK